MLNHLFILALLTPIVFCRQTVDERQWTEWDKRENCTEKCDLECQECTDPHLCDPETEVVCGCVAQQNQIFELIINCPCDEQCIPKHCECK